jgi:CheY-like chemotaxis protein
MFSPAPLVHAVFERMTSELLSLKLLIVFRSEAGRERLREGASLASIPVEIVTADSAVAAQSLLGQGGIDLVLIGAALPAADKAALSKAARSAKERPLIIVVGTDSDGTDADAKMAKPTTVEEAQSVVDRCIRARIPSRVLVVDDSATMRGIVRKILSASKFPLEISEADEGVKALEQLRAENFDLVFLDYNMPGLNGFETLTELKRAHPKVAVVMMTSTDNETFADRARQAGAAAFLKKPFFPADIDAVLYRFYGLDAPRRGA